MQKTGKKSINVLNNFFIIKLIIPSHYYKTPNVDKEWRKVDPYSKELDVLYLRSAENIKMDTKSDLGNQQFGNL